MNVKEIVKHYLKSNGYDGLYSDDCGCPVDDLFLCCGQFFFTDCKPGVKKNEKDFAFIGPREEQQLEEICKRLKCTGGLNDCPGNSDCPAVKFYLVKPVDCAAVMAYIQQQIDLIRIGGINGASKRKSV